MFPFHSRFHTPRIVLLVEDLEPLRVRLKASLESAGLFVLQTANCEEALRIARGRARSIDLLLTDMHLQGASGPVLALLLRADRPHMAALYMANSLTKMMEMPDVAEFLASLLPQPSSSEVLLRRVSVILASHA